MPVSFVEQFEAVARRVYRRRLSAAIYWLFAATATAGLALIAIDYLAGVYETPGRLALSFALLLAVIVAWRWVRRGIGEPITPLAVALSLEDRRPEHRSLLSSGVEFSGQEDGDPTAGSADLRRAVVLRAAVAAESIDLQATVPLTPLRHAAVAALTAITLIGIVAAAAPSVLTAGIVRLVNPLSDFDYPRKHDLAFRDLPDQLPAGGDFHATLVDRHGRLPEHTIVLFRTRRDGRWYYDSQDYRRRNATGIDVRWPSVRQSFEVRAVGGDDRTMRWRRVEVAPAPQVESIAVTVHPPAHTALPAETGSESVEMLAGSRLVVAGRVNVPVVAGELHSESGSPVKLSIHEDGHGFRTLGEAWSPQRSGEWSLSFTTAQGMTATADRRLQVEVVPDKPPSIEIVEPTENLAVLPEAVVDLQLVANDDLAVRRVQLVMRPVVSLESSAVGSDGEHVVDVFHRQGRPTPGRLELDHSLAISEYGLTAGSQWLVEARADDYANQVGQSLRPLRVRIIAPDEFMRQIGERMSRLSRVLQQAADQQQAAAERVAQWQETPGQSPTPEEAARLAQRQRELHATVAGERDSAVQLAQAVLQEYQRNRWPDVDAAARADQLVQKLSSLAEQELPAIEARLTSFNRSIREDASAALSPSQLEHLQDVHDRQQQTLAALERALGDLSQWSDVQQFRRDVGRLQREQDALLERTAELARQSLVQNTDQRDEFDRQARQAADMQRELASQLGGALERGRQAAEDLSETQAQDATAMQSALAQAEQGRAQSQARAAADQLRAGRFGQAAESQRQVSEQMQKVLDRMTASIGPLDQLDATLKQLVADQLEVVTELQRLRAANGGSNRAAENMPAEAAVAARRQATIRERTVSEAEEVPMFPVFVRLLAGAADTMRGVETEVAEEGASKRSTALAMQAHDQLRRLAEAVHEQGRQRLSPSPPSGDKQPGGEQRPQVSPEQLQAMQLTLAQLGLLRQMQADLKSRTENLEEQAALHATKSESLNERSVKLAEEQQKLEEMADELRDAAAQLPAPTVED